LSTRQGNEDEDGSHRDEASVCGNALDGTVRPLPNTSPIQSLRELPYNNATTQSRNYETTVFRDLI
jgi:hypothetical protein